MNLQLSIVIPAFNEATRISSTIEKVVRYCQAKKTSYEIIVVDDGSFDQTAAQILSLARSHPNLRLFSSPKNEGKGAAVRRGVMLAEGKNILFFDADSSTPIEELDKILPQDFQVAIGSRRLTASAILIRQPFFREAMGKMFSVAVRLFFPALRDIIDTQCGFKVFKKEIAKEIFGRAKVNGFLFDVEILLLCKKRGYSITQVPVIWENASGSKVSLLWHFPKVIQELWQIKREIN